MILNEIEFQFFKSSCSCSCLNPVFPRFITNTASPVSGKMGPTGSVSASPKAFNPGLVPKQERTSGTGGILNLNLGQYHKHHGMQLHAYFGCVQYFQRIFVSN